MINMQDTEERFNKYPSPSTAHLIESRVEGVSIDYGYSHSVSGNIHENLVEDSNEPY